MKQTVEEAARENILFNHRTVDRTLFGKDLAKFGEINFVQGAEWQSKQSPWISVKEEIEKAMKGNIFDKIRKASNKYIEYMIACDDISKEAQKHIDWDDNVSCEYYPSDGICIMIDEHVCYANTFFDLVEESENGMIDRKTYMRNCI